MTLIQKLLVNVATNVLHILFTSGYYKKIIDMTGRLYNITLLDYYQSIRAISPTHDTLHTNVGIGWVIVQFLTTEYKILGGFKYVHTDTYNYKWRMCCLTTFNIITYKLLIKKPCGQCHFKLSESQFKYHSVHNLNNTYLHVIKLFSQ